MPRTLSLHRRRANLVDLTIQSQPGVGSYQFQAATNFDSSFTTFDTVPVAGKISKTAVDLAIGGSSGFRGFTRFVFDPADYVISGVSETVPMFLRYKPIPVFGAGVSPTPGTASAIHMVLPYSSVSDRPLVLSGTAPAGASIANSLELQLPAQCRNLQVQVNGSVDLYIAFEPGGTEMLVPALSTSFINLSLISPIVTQIFVRGDNLATQFNAVMSLKNNPSG